MTIKSTENLLITIAGRHGAGRSTNAKLLAESFGLKCLSAGMIFRERAKELGVSLEEMNKLATQDCDFDNYLDARTKEESRKKGIVIDANLSAWMAEDIDLRIFVTCSFDERVRRIALRETRSIEDVAEETRAREVLEQERYQRYYDVNINDLTIYDLILNTELFSIEATARILKNVVREYVNRS